MEEKRKFQRVNISFPIKCESSETKNSFYTVFKDISKGGVKLITNEFMKINKQLKIEINLVSKLIKGKGRVAWCNAQPYSDRYIAGIEFTELSKESEKELASFLAEIIPS